MGAIKEQYFDEIVEGLGKTGTTEYVYEMECKKCVSQISYYQEKIDQWYYLDSFGEDWSDHDREMVKGWETTVKNLKQKINN
jgi:hypothetical protein